MALPEVDTPPPARKPRSDEPDKPPYVIPSVDDIRKLEGSNGLTAISTFAGAGGSSTGYRWAGFHVPWVNEFLDLAADTYKTNWPDSIVDRRDIRDVIGKEILDVIGMSVGELDLFDGSPPCQPFSSAGKRHHNWHKEVDHADGTVNLGGSEDLVYEWGRLVDELQPRVAVMENVKGLTIGKAKGYLIRLLDYLRSIGYKPDVRLLDAQWLGTPQRRVRCYIIATRDDLNLSVAWPTPFPYRYTIADACPWIGHVDARMWGTERTEWPVEKPSPTIVASGAAQNRPAVRNRQPVRHIVGNDAFSPIYGGVEKPHPTIMAGGPGRTSGMVQEGSAEPRKFTIAECKRLCGFPDDYVLLGSYADQWARLGNSVVPPMARAVGSAVADALSTPE